MDKTSSDLFCGSRTVGHDDAIPVVQEVELVLL